MKIAKLLLRAIVGGLFVGHGTQKLLGWFGGRGLDATAQGFESMGMRPGRHHAIAAGVAETAGGATLALGLATPLSAAALTATMLTAITRVHLKNGPWATNGGYEYNLVLIAIALLLAEEGPGPLSLDAALGEERKGPGWGAFALVAGALGANLANVYAKSQAAAPPAAAAAAAASAAEESGDPAGNGAAASVAQSS